MSLKNKKENDEKRCEEKIEESNIENEYAINCVDYCYCQHSQVDDGDTDVPFNQEGNFDGENLDELTLLEFFNDFSLMDIGFMSLLEKFILSIDFL